MQTQTPIRINLPASSVAAAVGLNPYSSQQDLVHDTWRRVHNLPCGNQLTKHLVKKEHAEVLEVYQSLVARDIIKRPVDDPAGERKSALVKEINFSTQLAIKDINQQHATTTKQKKAVETLFKGTGISDAAEGAARMSAGTQKEGNILDDLEMALGVKLGEKNSVMHTKTLTIDGVELCIRGKVDAVVQEGTKKGQVVEVKNRRSRFLTPRGGMPPVYEQVQCEIYAWFTGTQELGVCHCESFNGRTRITEYKHRPELWDQIVEGLGTFVAAYKKLDSERMSKQGLLEIDAKLEAAKALVGLRALKVA